MPLPLTSLFAAAAATLGSSALTRLMGTRVGTAFAGRQSVNVTQLGRRLGTPRPSQSQVDDERMRLARESAKGSLIQLAVNGKKAALVMGMVGGFGAAVIGVTKALEGFSTRTLERQRKLDFLHPAIAAAFSRLDFQTLRLNARTAAGTSQTTTTLANAVMRMQESGQPLREATTNLRNVMGTFSAMVAQAMLDFANRSGWPDTLDGIAKGLDLMFRGGLRNQLGTEDYRQFMREMSKGKFGNAISQTPGDRNRGIL